MKSRNIPYLPAVDHLRAFASLLILLYHSEQLIGQHLLFGQLRPQRMMATWNPFHAFFLEGHTAVSLFIVLSGFIFTYGTLGREIRYGGFLRNRLLRIYPLFLALLMVGAAAFPRRFTLAGFAQSLLSLGNFPGGLPLGPVSAMFWAVAVEFQLYLVFPLLLAVLNRSGWRPMALMVAAAVVFRALAVGLGGEVYSITYSTVAGRFDQFVIGMLAAAWFRSEGFDRRSWARALVPSLAAILVLLTLFNRAGSWPAQGSWRVAWPTVEAASWAAFLLAYLSFAHRIPARLSALLARIGLVSYSTYLLHFLVISLVVQHRWFFRPGLEAPLVGLLNGAVLIAPLVLLLASLTYAAVERPFLELRGRYLEPLPASPPVAPEG